MLLWLQICKFQHDIGTDIVSIQANIILGWMPKDIIDVPLPVHIGSGIGLLLLGSKPLPEPMLISDAICHQMTLQHRFDVITMLLLRHVSPGTCGLLWVHSLICVLPFLWLHYIYGLVPDSSISIANALEILKSYTKPTICNILLSQTMF